jgi:hypothetical protein
MLSLKIVSAFERVRETDYAKNHNNFSDKQHDLEPLGLEGDAFVVIHAKTSEFLETVLES